MWVVLRREKTPDYDRGPGTPDHRWNIAGATEHEAFEHATDACKHVAGELEQSGTYAAFRVTPVTVRLEAE